MVELPASVENRHHDLGGGAFLGRVLTYRNATAVVFDGNRVVEVHLHVDTVAETGQRLVDRVVDDLVDHVVEPAAVISVADVHARPHAHGLESLENLNALLVVLVAGLLLLLVYSVIRFRGHRKNLELSVT